MKKYRNYTDKDIIENAAKVTSLAQLLGSLGLEKAGGNYSNMKKNLQRLGLDCEHWKGQGWNKGERLKNWSEYTKNESVKKHLIKELGRKCQKCKTEIWFGEPVCIEMHHIDGNKTNYNRENLLLLCLNCHGLTKNWKGRKP